MTNQRLKQFGKVGVLMGGKSAEREISLKSGAAVLSALQRSGVDAQRFDPATRTLGDLGTAEFDRVFITLHGRYGEDGCIQGALDLMDIPYTGSDVMASAIGMDKWRTKLLWQAVGLPTPEYALLTATTDFAGVERQLGMPIFVKPAREGSSIGMTKVKQAGNLKAAYELATQYDDLVIAEKFVDGGEYTCAILGAQVLPMIQLVPKTEYYDFDAKYLRDDTEYRCPCGLPPDQEAAIQNMCLKAFQVVGCRGWGRVDVMLDKQGSPYLLELNTSPGMTDHSLVPMAARAAGMSFDELCVRILEQTLDGR
ncbi:MAG: D-alanine--D-alanine ligase [Thiobacillaceae bacterium]